MAVVGIVAFDECLFRTDVEHAFPYRICENELCGCHVVLGCCHRFYVTVGCVGCFLHQLMSVVVGEEKVGIEVDGQFPYTSVIVCVDECVVGFVAPVVSVAANRFY